MIVDNISLHRALRDARPRGAKRQKATSLTSLPLAPSTIANMRTTTGDEGASVDCEGELRTSSETDRRSSLRKHIIEQRLLHGIVTGQKLQQGCLTLLNRGCSMQALLSLGFNKTATNISEEGAALRSCHWNYYQIDTHASRRPRALLL